MQHTNYSIKVMSRQDVDIAMDWAAAEGWNPGINDAECFYQADKNGFFVGSLDGQPISMISAVKYGTSFGFIGFYIVHPDYRSQGFGMPIWQKAMSYLKGRTIGLDGVVDQQSNYRKSGFVLAHQNIRFEYKKTATNTRELMSTANVVDLTSVPIERLFKYDAHHFPDKRVSFLKCWFQMRNGKGVVYTENKSIYGYGIIRQCRVGYKIGPLFANNPNIAKVIFEALVTDIPEGESIFLDIPETNLDAVALVNQFGMQKSFETARMYKGTTPDLPIHNIYGVTTFELG